MTARPSHHGFSLRLRVFLLFAALAASVLAALVLALVWGASKAQGPTGEGFVIAGIAAGFTITGLIAALWGAGGLATVVWLTINASAYERQLTAQRSNRGLTSPPCHPYTQVRYRLLPLSKPSQHKGLSWTSGLNSGLSCLETLTR